MDRSWSIGKAPENDLVVDRQTVSGRHCHLIREGENFFVQDVGSSNGTYVNGIRISGRVRVTRADTITLGALIPMPWPVEESKPRDRVVTIGREPDNDVVIHLPIVSGHHARVVWDGSAALPILEDLNSANGTALGSPERKVVRSTLRIDDTIFLGSHPLSAAEIFWKLDPDRVPRLSVEGNLLVLGRDPGCERVVDHPSVADRHASLVRVGGSLRIADLGSSTGTFVNGRRIDGETLVRSGDLVGLGTHAFILEDQGGTLDTEHRPSAAVLENADRVVAPTPESVVSKSPEPVGNRGESRPIPRFAWSIAIHSAQVVAISILIVVVGRLGPETGSPRGLVLGLFLMAVAAIGFGVVSVLLGRADGNRVEGVAVCLAISLAETVILWLIAANGIGLKASALPTLGILAISSAIGIAIGWLIVANLARSARAWATVAMLLVGLWGLGGERWPVHDFPAPVRFLSESLPSRWAFEGLLLLESERRPELESLVEVDFPGETARMGVIADATALIAMLVGWSALAIFIASAKQPRRVPELAAA